MTKVFQPITMINTWNMHVRDELSKKYYNYGGYQDRTTEPWKESDKVRDIYDSFNMNIRFAKDTNAFRVNDANYSTVC